MNVDLVSQEYKRDPGPTLDHLLAAGPVTRARIPIIGEMTFVTTHAAVEAMLKNEALFSTDVANGRNRRISVLLRFMPRNIRVMTSNMLQKDGEEHRRLRKMVDGAFRRGAVEAWVPRIEGIADCLLDDWIASDDGDFVRHVARALPLAVICEILGLPEADRPQFTRWMAALSDAGSLRGLPRLYISLSRMNRYLMARFEERRKRPGEDLISILVHASDDGDNLSDDEVLAMLGLLFIAGHETTTHLISGSVLTLLQHPNELARLRADPSIEAAAVEELLRFVGAVEMTKPRYLRHDAEFMGTRFRKGDAIMAHLSAANRDATAFNDPHRLDLTRKPNRHVALGGGPHFCLGAWLAKAELAVVLRRLWVKAPDVAVAMPEGDLRWTRQSGIRALTTLPLTPTPHAGMKDMI